MPRMTQQIHAERLARAAHAGQNDRSGRAYWRHLQAVADRVSGDKQQATAWLHDVIEDTHETGSSLRIARIDEVVILNVKTLTQRPTETYGEYIKRIAQSGHEIAIEVKLADLEDHLQHKPEQLPASLRERYHRARRRLLAVAQEGPPAERQAG